MATNRAAWIDKDNRRPLRVDVAEVPTPGDDEIVVKNHAIAINPVDWKIQDYGVFIQTWPNVLGTDIAGEVYAVGKNVTRFQKGNRVLSHVRSLLTNNPHHGGFQLYTATLESFAARIPSNISFTEAAVLPLAIDTAAQGLYDKREQGFLGLPYPSLDPKPLGKTILVWGGSSSVGALAIQLATASGATVVAVASKHNHEFVKGLGAVAATDYHGENVVEEVVQAVKSAGGEFAGIYEAVANEASYKFTVPIIEKLGGGNVAVVLEPPSQVPSNSKFGRIFAINPIVEPLWKDYVTPALEQGKLKAVPEPLVIGKGLESVQKGLEKNKAGVSARKVVVEL